MSKSTHPIIAVAPMLDWTDRHDRYFLRLIAPDILLYTEMITTHALVHGDRDYLLKFHPAEKYLALQLGGNDPTDLAKSAAWGEAAGYDEINLNVGCPSARVKSGQFGACLMLTPNVVAEGVRAMRAATSLPVTVKCRIGVDDVDSYAALKHFIEAVAAAGCDRFIIHARKAWLSGLSPKQNREIPPLCYETVWRIKQDFPMLTIIINGGIKTLAQIETQLQHVDGVMIGREAYANPFLLAEIQAHYWGNAAASRAEVVQRLLPYVEAELKSKTKLSNITRHILGLFHGQAGAANWRRTISESAHLPHMGASLLTIALDKVNQ